MTQPARKSRGRKRMTKSQRENLEDLKSGGFVGRDNPGERVAKFSEMRSRPGIYPDQENYPGYEEERYNHAQKEFKHVDTEPGDFAFLAMANEAYRLGGWPKWVIDQTSILDRSIYLHALKIQSTFEGEFFESTRRIARTLGCKGDSVQRSLRHMRDLGLLVTIYPATGKSPAHYRTRSPWELEPPIEPLKPRRKSGFIGKDQDENTKEGDARPSSPYRADGQNTKTSVVVDVVALGATQRSTTPKKVDRPLSASDKKVNRKTQEKLDRESKRPKLLSHFTPNQVTDEKLNAYLDNSRTLRLLFDGCMEIEQKWGFFNPTLGATEPGEFSNPDVLLAGIRDKLTDGLFDLRYPEAGIETAIRELYAEFLTNSREVKHQFEIWQTQEKNRLAREEYEAKRKEGKRVEAETLERQRMETERLRTKRAESERLTKRLGIHAQLAIYREQLSNLVPDLDSDVEVWGVWQVLYYQESKTLTAAPVIQEIYSALASLSNSHSWNEVPYDQQAKLLEDWYRRSLSLE